MKVIDIGAPTITLIDKNGKEIKMLISSYDTYGNDEIVITTQIRETDLHRGWVGDLVCCVPCGKNFETYADEENTDVHETYRNVLLRNVVIDSVDMQEAIMWKYTFLKD